MTEWSPPSATNLDSVTGRQSSASKVRYAKTSAVQNEKLASDLAEMVPVPVPHVEISIVQGLGLCAISLVHSPGSRPLVKKRVSSETTRQRRGSTPLETNIDAADSIAKKSRQISDFL